MTEGELDTLLAAPLAPVADDGFSAALVARMAERERLQTGLEWAGLALAAFVLLLVLPLDQAGAVIETLTTRLATNLGTSVPLAVGIGTLVISLYAARLADPE